MIRILILLLSLLTISGCDNTAPINKQFDREGEWLKVKVVFVKNEKEMKTFSWKYEKGLQGQTLYSPNDLTCEIVVYEIYYVDKDPTKTIGHELIHCLYGNYHD